MNGFNNTADLRILLDCDTNQKFYPYTHEKAVVGENGEEVIKTLKNGISDLNLLLGHIPNDNVFNYFTCTLNQLLANDGSLYPNEYWCTTDFIMLNNNKVITMGYGVGRVAFYNSGKEMLSLLYINEQNADHGYVEVDVPTNARYVRCCTYMDFNESTEIYLCGVSYIGKKNKVDSVYEKKDFISNVYHVGKNSVYDFTTLRDAIEEAIKYPRSVVYVNDGLYNLLEEFSDVFSNGMVTQQGIKLENDVHIIFSTKAKVTCLYDGKYVDKIEFFSPFYGGENGGFTLENLDIEASNTRYCVHDDQPRATKFRSNNYVNCKMKMDNTKGAINWYPQCIGGGVSDSLKVLVRGCYFKSKWAEEIELPLVSYHNTKELENPSANVIIENSYFADKGTFRCTHYGETTSKSTAFVNHNSFGSEPYVAYEVPDSATPENFEMLAFCNEVRK